MSLGEYLGAGGGITKGLYHLNGDANDSSGNGNNGTASNVTWVGGKLGSGAASFNGSSSVITTSYTAVPTNAIILSCWVKHNANTTDERICGRGDNTVSDSVFQLCRNTFGVGKIGCIIRNSSGNSSDLVTPTTISNGVRHNIICTGDTATGYILYVDGVLVASTGTGRTIGQRAFTIGRATNAACYFNGLIDEVIIESRTWTAAEIKKYYTMTKGRFGIL